ncbi:hypothetical protein WJX73_008495 [Symbiochloris irregularis]|uniref:Uncharacterized protein n=1 Tax=Symbiochloris irregularis TaxID=706552 RepID=A0AAW1NVT2_9CHLO
MRAGPAAQFVPAQQLTAEELAAQHAEESLDDAAAQSAREAQQGAGSDPTEAASARTTAASSWWQHSSSNTNSSSIHNSSRRLPFVFGTTQRDKAAARVKRMFSEGKLPAALAYSNVKHWIASPTWLMTGR